MPVAGARPRARPCLWSRGRLEAGAPSGSCLPPALPSPWRRRRRASAPLARAIGRGASGVVATAARNAGRGQVGRAPGELNTSAWPLGAQEASLGLRTGSPRGRGVAAGVRWAVGRTDRSRRPNRVEQYPDGRGKGADVVSGEEGRAQGERTRERGGRRRARRASIRRAPHQGRKGRPTPTGDRRSTPHTAPGALGPPHQATRRAAAADKVVAIAARRGAEWRPGRCRHAHSAPSVDERHGGRRRAGGVASDGGRSELRCDSAGGGRVPVRAGSRRGGASGGPGSRRPSSLSMRGDGVWACEAKRWSRTREGRGVRLVRVQGLEARRLEGKRPPRRAENTLQRPTRPEASLPVRRLLSQVSGDLIA